ncbi:MAG: hypothetical protein QNJ42_04410 [Crocosphaera sp.]|nr:hypothetical protein [Crocosphaera sp.]
MKILLDECIDRRLATYLIEYNVKTVSQMRWSGTKNGQLLGLAAVEFDVFITVDQNLHFEQNLQQFDLAIIVLQTFSNRLADLKLLVPQIISSLPKISKREATIIKQQN